MTVNGSLGSTTVWSATLTVIVLLVSPAVNLLCPKEGPHRQSPTQPRDWPLPVTAQLALLAMLVLPPRDRESEPRGGVGLPLVLRGIAAEIDSVDCPYLPFDPDQCRA